MPGSKLTTRLLACLLVWTTAAQAAGVRFDRLTISEGLSQSTVMSMAQDSRGFMWFGTQDGLNRYDGNQFLILRPKGDDPQALPDNNIHALMAGDRGSLWVGTDGGGLALLDTYTNTARSFRHRADNAASLAGDWVTAIARDRRGGVWVGLKHSGVDRYLPATRTFRHYRPPAASGCGADVLALFVEDTRHLLVGTAHDGLCRLDMQEGSWAHIALEGAAVPTQVTAIARGEGGTLWVGTHQGLFVLHPSGEQQHVTSKEQSDGFSLSSDEVHALLRDSTGKLWIGTQHGLDRYDPRTRKILHFHSVPGDPNSLAENNIGSLLEDASGLIWIGTLSNGISKFNPRQEAFKSITVAQDPSHGLSNPVVWSVVEDTKGMFWIGTESGLNRYDPRSGLVRQFRHSGSVPNSPSNNNIRDVLVGPAGRIWLATRGGGLDAYDPLTGRFEHYRHDERNPHSLASDDLLTLVADGSRGLWIGTAGAGLDHFSFDSGKFQHFPPQPADPGSLPQGDVYAIEPDGTGGFWLGTLMGLTHFDPASGRFKTYVHDPADPNSLSNNGVGIIVRAQDGTLWIGTDMGLNHFDPKTGRFKVFTTANGLPNNFIYGIVLDHGKLWFSTNRGLSHLDPHTGRVDNYTMLSGLSSDEFNTGACYRDSSGNIYFGSVNGLDYFDPAQITPNRHSPPVAITEFKVFDHTVPIAEALRAGRPIHLSYHDDFFSIQFAALDYAAPLANRYAYRLEGFDDSWIQNDHRNYVSYTNLDGGSYRFHVIASNNDGVWNDTGVTVPIIVDSPPWQTWWAYMLYAAAAVLLLRFVVQRKARASAHALAEKLNTLGQEFNKSLDADAILTRYLAALHDFIPFRSGKVCLYKDGAFEVCATIPESAEEGGLTPLEGALLARARNCQYTLGVRNEAHSEPLAVTDLNIHKMQVLAIPLVREYKVLGAAILHADHPGVFTQEHRDMGRTLRLQATTALQNALLYSEIRRHAITDDLTGLANRRQFFTRGETEVRRAERYGRALSLLMIDMDHFKQVNDTFGHGVGDAVLRCLGETLLVALRETDIAARYGGEEFSILLPETDLDGALRAAERIAALFARATRGDKDLPEVTLSIGVAASNQVGLKLGVMLKAADAALYAAKEQGRDRIIAYDASILTREPG